MKNFQWFLSALAHPCGSMRATRFAKQTSIVVLLAQAVVHGAGPPLQFAKMVGTSFGLAVSSDSQGNIYVGTGYETALVKYDSQGNQVWSFGVVSGASGTMAIRGIFIDSWDDVYVYGDLSGKVKAGAIDYDRSFPATFF